MNIKNGLVIDIKGNAAYIMTSSGEFFKIKIDKNKALPVIGGEYSSRTFENSFVFLSKFKYAVAACLLFFMVSLGGGTYAYYTPTSTVTIDINPSIEFKLNRWSRVLSSNSLNSDGEEVLSEIKTKNKPIEDVLIMVINQAKEDKYINDEYINLGKLITINIVGKEVGLSNLEEEVSKDTINVKIDSNGKNIYNKSNRKLDDATPKKNSDKNSNVSTNANSAINKSSTVENNSNINANKIDKSVDNTGKNDNSSNGKYNNASGNGNKKDNNNSNIEKPDEKFDKDKTDDHHNSSKEDKNSKNK